MACFIPGMPHQRVPSRNLRFAKSMRRAPTEVEDKLWQELRSRRLDRIKFRRQMPLGNYIADFVCLEARLIIEIDGSQHGDSAYDASA